MTQFPICRARTMSRTEPYEEIGKGAPYSSTRRVQGKVVTGYYTYMHDGDEDDEHRHLIYQHKTSWFMGNFSEVVPESLAISTDLQDKNGVTIFASFEVDGVMSKGGDVVTWQRLACDGKPAGVEDSSVKWCLRHGWFQMSNNDGTAFQLGVMLLCNTIEVIGRQDGE